jgi:hypothetical protein
MGCSRAASVQPSLAKDHRVLEECWGSHPRPPPLCAMDMLEAWREQASMRGRSRESSRMPRVTSDHREFDASCSVWGGGLSAWGEGNGQGSKGAGQQGGRVKGGGGGGGLFMLKWEWLCPVMEGPEGLFVVEEWGRERRGRKRNGKERERNARQKLDGRSEKKKKTPSPPAVVKHLQSPRGKKKGGQASGRSAHTKDKIKKEHPLYV